jgi:bifunctional UDP-N-acetylglucosamine pyrophosphorylase/glucosamine-1-phosphate N-acetyltransferase
MSVESVILAAGQGTRMRSRLPKVIHPLMGKPLICHALQAARKVCQGPPVVVVSRSADAVRQAVCPNGGAAGSGEPAARFVIQEEQLGTAHALMQAAPLLEGCSAAVLMTSADMPLLTPETLQRLVDAQRSEPRSLSMLTVIAENPRGFGRVLRLPDGGVQAVVEEAQATLEQLALRELNAGAYCFPAEWLWRSLPIVPVSPKGEYYVTDLIALAREDGRCIHAIVLDDAGEAIGVNTRVDLADAERYLRQRINRQWMLGGVTIIDPQSTYIEPGVVLGQDTVIWPNTFLQGRTRVGEGCTLGPNTLLRDATIGREAQVLQSVLTGVTVDEGTRIGPFAHLSGK